MQQQRWNILFELTLFSRIQFTSCKRHWCLENVVFSRKKKRNSSSCNFFPLIKSACVLREVCNYCYILLYICRVHAQCKSGWDDDGDDDDVDGGADFFAFLPLSCFIRWWISSSNRRSTSGCQVLMLTLLWFCSVFLKSFSDFSLMYCFVKLRASVIIDCLSNWKSNWVKKIMYATFILLTFWLTKRYLITYSS